MRILEFNPRALYRERQSGAKLCFVFAPMSVRNPVPETVVAADIIELDENASLLADHAAYDGSHRGSTSTRISIGQKHRPLFVVSLCTAHILLIDVGVSLQIAPLTRILESIICRSYYGDQYGGGGGTIPEHMCKITAVQSELAMLKGWSSLFDCVPSKLKRESR
jgi:hypothetical protein